MSPLLCSHENQGNREIVSVKTGSEFRRRFPQLKQVINVTITSDQTIIRNIGPRPVHTSSTGLLFDGKLLYGQSIVLAANSPKEAQVIIGDVFQETFKFRQVS
mgnify:CR=1 FL=1